MKNASVSAPRLSFKHVLCVKILTCWCGTLDNSHTDTHSCLLHVCLLHVVCVPVVYPALDSGGSVLLEGRRLARACESR